MRHDARLDIGVVLIASLAAAWPVGELAGQAPSDPVGPGGADLSGEVLYGAACAACHGLDGAGMPAARVGFDVPLPDFTDCSFASREPDADWVAVAHEGGPVRGFDPMMPAFGAALSVDQLQRVMTWVRTFCGDAEWPAGELNLPRAMVTEKAYPEDEAVLAGGVALSGAGAVESELVWEQRFGARSQVELVVPWGFRERSDGGWSSGLGDVVLGVKRDMWHSAGTGSILALAGEVKLPTGDESEGFGAGTPIMESFVSFGQILPSDAFVQVQAVLEVPWDDTLAEREGALRLAAGRTFTEGSWGRTWTPMVEILGSRELESGATVSWDLLPQLQVSLNTRQHVLLDVGVRLPVVEKEGRGPQLLVYLLWDWFDGGFFDGW